MISNFPIGLTHTDPEFRLRLNTLVDEVNSLRAALDAARKANRIYIARIVSSASAGTRRWNYTVREVIRTGDNTYTDLTNGWGDPTPVTAQNGLEKPNGATGIQGNGVDDANLVGTFDLVPLGDGAIVPVHVSVANDGTVLHTIFGVNQIDGACNA